MENPELFTRIVAGIDEINGLEAAFIAATEPEPQSAPLTESELENRALVKECDGLIASIAARRKEAGAQGPPAFIVPDDDTRVRVKAGIMAGVNEIIGKEKLLKKLVRAGAFRVPASGRAALGEAIGEWRNSGSPGTLAGFLAGTVLAETYSVETLLQAAAELGA